MSSIRKILIVVLVGLLAACSGQQNRQLTLIMEGMPQQDSLTMPDGTKAKPQYGEILFINDQNMLDAYAYEGGADTVSISCTKPYLEVSAHELFFIPEVKKSFGSEHLVYALLQAGDTVRLHWKEGANCQFESLHSPSLTKLYNLDSEFSATKYVLERVKFGLVVAYFKQQKQLVNGKLLKSGGTPESVMAKRDSLMQQYRHTIDSLVAIGLPPAYEQYYSYRLAQLGSPPLQLERVLKAGQDSLNPELLATLSDSLCNYISYWISMTEFRTSLVRPSGQELPKLNYVDSAGPTPKPAWTFDERVVFDKLSDYANSVPPHTLNLLRYQSLDIIQRSTHPPYPETDKELYMKKYRELTTDYLDISYASVNSLVGWPFRFLSFLAEFSLCSGLFFIGYRSLLRAKLSYTGRRATMLTGLLLSALIPLLTLSWQLQAIEKVTGWGVLVNRIADMLFALYLAVCLYLCYELLCWFLQLERMRKDSWLIPEKGHTVCVMMHTKEQPSVFGRKVFFSWDDWWNVESKETRNLILEVELYHVRKWHWVDSLLLAFLRTICWANPFLLRYNTELKQTNDLAARQSVEAHSKAAEIGVPVLQKGGVEGGSQSGLIYGLAGSGYQLHLGHIGAKLARWIHSVRYQIIIPVILFVVLMLSVELVSTVGHISEVVFAASKTSSL